MSRHILLRLLLGGVGLVAIIWLIDQTEWVEEQVFAPARGPARDDSYYAMKSLLKQLNVKIEQQQNLRVLPPMQARLLLISRHWNVLEDRDQALRHWVDSGGQLIIGGNAVTDKVWQDWLPVSREKKIEPKTKAQMCMAHEHPSEPSAKYCRHLVEISSAAVPYYGDGGLHSCIAPPSYDYVPASHAEKTPLWRIDAVHGNNTEIIRMPYGKGSVTVIGNLSLLTNAHVLHDDNSLLIAAALQAQPQATLWIVAEESRQQWFIWIWRNTWPAVVLGLLTLALLLWRAAVRFGPVLPPESVHRRSMSEQVRGTGRFLQAHGSHALHAAQLRAVHESAAQHLPGYAMLDDAARAAALAHASGIDAQTLAQALQAQTNSVSPDTLALLERVRRRLIQ